MKFLRNILIAAPLLAATMSGCATGMLATPHEQLVMRPDLSVAGLLGNWEPLPLMTTSGDVPVEPAPIRVVRNSEGELLFEVANDAYELRLIPYSSQANRYLAEIQQVKLGDLELKKGLSVLAVVSVEDDTLSIWYLNGIKLAEAMREDGRSGNFQHHFLISEIDADPQDMIRTIEAHASELLSVPIQYRAVEEPQDFDSGLKE